MFAGGTFKEHLRELVRNRERQVSASQGEASLQRGEQTVHGHFHSVLCSTKYGSGLGLELLYLQKI